ncbi:uncharacterized protein BDR25DRAFT_395074 [Lindgomyces ingoldianus]|uniref:Uncharacterized protein n=1 Tax=Lindgomyces ingoldianus TaxID=673940 RepID=A0ACB6QLY5_9PLEO|nr:uncharacterized protein BDR25DRAFT_395074 [Lindgomyces ingoldianus]KAF2467882.1 hypothetical protein BDR25DRAFT_395074 [Lindgomyces ingoldianus]
MGLRHVNHFQTSDVSRIAMALKAQLSPSISDFMFLRISSELTILCFSLLNPYPCLRKDPICPHFNRSIMEQVCYQSTLRHNAHRVHRRQFAWVTYSISAGFVIFGGFWASVLLAGSAMVIGMKQSLKKPFSPYSPRTEQTMQLASLVVERQQSVVLTQTFSSYAEFPEGFPKHKDVVPTRISQDARRQDVGLHATSEYQQSIRKRCHTARCESRERIPPLSLAMPPYKFSFHFPSTFQPLLRQLQNIPEVLRFISPNPSVYVAIVTYYECTSPFSFVRIVIRTPKHTSTHVPSFQTAVLIKPSPEIQQHSSALQKIRSKYPIPCHPKREKGEKTMASIGIRTTASGQLSSTALAAVLTGVGVVILGLLISLVFLLCRAVRTHNRYLKDLEERGVAIAQSQARQSKTAPIAKPRRVLRRSAILPFNSKNGWGTLSSVKTIKTAKLQSISPHSAPPKPVGFVDKPSCLSWPFSTRRSSGRAIHLKKIKVPTLPTVIEGPKLSTLVPRLSDSLGCQPFSPKRTRSHRSSGQSLQKRHPAFRSDWQDENHDDVTATQPEPRCRSLATKPITKTETRLLPNGSGLVAEIPVSLTKSVQCRVEDSKLHTRSASVCSQRSGNDPEAPMPPLPLHVTRPKSGSQQRSLLSKTPSQLSVYGLESAGSSILATQSSPILPHYNNIQVQKCSRRNWRNSLTIGPRPFGGMLTLHERNKRSQGSINSNTARYSVDTPSAKQKSQTENRRSTMNNNSSGVQSIRKVEMDERVLLSKVVSPTYCPLSVQYLNTPRQQSRSQVAASGSPQERSKRTSILRGISRMDHTPTRQLSQDSTQVSSTRSSNGNPFQWDSTTFSWGKPPTLKGSPAARSAHQRQNCVRISLVPIILRPPSGTSSPCPSVLNNDQEDLPHPSVEKKTGLYLNFSNARSLPRPPSSPMFASDVNITATTTCASLTPNPPMLSMANDDHRPTEPPMVSDSLWDLQNSSPRTLNRMSSWSLLSIPKFPRPCCNLPAMGRNMSPPPTFALSQSSNEYDDELKTPDSQAAPSSPLDDLPLFSSSPQRPLLVDQYNPEYPYLVYHTPTSSPTLGQFPSPFSTFPEESSATSARTMNYERLSDPPPCSPEMMRPHAFLPLPQDQLLRYSSIQNTACPSILSKDTFSTLNSSSEGNYSPCHPENKPIPNNSTSAQEMSEPFIEAAFTSSPPSQQPGDSRPSQERVRSPTQSGLAQQPLTAQSFPSSTYFSVQSSPQPTRPFPPRSPYPCYAQLPAPTLNFRDMPSLPPSASGRRRSSPRPLQSSIQRLRHMNLEAEKGGQGERRYLRWDQEERIPLPGDGSWLKEAEIAYENEEALGEEKERRPTGGVLDSWEQESTILEIVEDDTLATSTSTGAETVELRKKPNKSNAGASSIHLTSPQEDEENRNRSSNVWDNDENFWHSIPPHLIHPPSLPNKPKNNFQSVASSPNHTATAANPSMPNSSRKREFEVAKDDSPATLSISSKLDKLRGDRKLAGGQYRKRYALGLGTPNVRIQVVSPSGSVDGTPGSLYDADGFLKA